MASVIPGDAIHIIKKISMPSMTFLIINKFRNMNIKNSIFDVKKIFFIKEIFSIICKEKITDVVIFSKNWISNNPDDIGFWSIYKEEDGNINYGNLDTNDNAKALYDNCLKLYENFMDRLDNKPVSLEKNAIEISELVESTNEISIKLKKNASYFYLIFNNVGFIKCYFSDLLRMIKLSDVNSIPHSFGLIYFKKFKFDYNTFVTEMHGSFEKVHENDQDKDIFKINGKNVYFSHSGVKAGRYFIKLDNVIVDGFYNKLFFAYEDNFYEVNRANIITKIDNYIKKYPMLTKYVDLPESEKSLTQLSIDAVLHKAQHFYDQSDLTNLAVSLSVL